MGDTFRLLIAGLWVIAGSAWGTGQLDIQASLEHDTFLLYEPIRLKIEIHNRLTTPLSVGADRQVTLILDVRDENGALLPREDGCPPIEGEVDPGGTLETSLNLLDCYDLRRPRSYSLRVLLVHGDSTLQRGPFFFEIRLGRNEARESAVLPDGARRRYALYSLVRDGAERLLLQVENPDAAACLGTIDFGRVLRFYHPRLTVDAEGRGHVVYQSGETSPPVFVHVVVGPNGAVVHRETVAQPFGGTADLVPDNIWGYRLKSSGE